MEPPEALPMPPLGGSSSPATSSRSLFASHDVRLAPREWLVAAGVIAAVFILTPLVWTRLEPLEITPDYRVPYPLSTDYWLYDRYVREVCRRDRTLVLGDSVIWGHYVAPGETLSAQLNLMTTSRRSLALAGASRFANLGVDGIHPVALEGLVRYDGRAIAGRRVLLHLNLLWMSSKRHDLQTPQEFAFHHPRLVPQFYPRIPCYREPISGRLGIVIGRRVPFIGWAEHLRLAYFEQKDISAWTLAHPYANPLNTVTLRLPPADEPPVPRPESEPWTRKHMAALDAEWVDLDTSLQWRSMRRTVELLRRRGNRLFVLVGPFNEHILEPESLKRYKARQRAVSAWLEANGIPHLAPPPLASDLYADASHPLAAGYGALARQLRGDEAFAAFEAGR